MIVGWSSVLHNDAVIRSSEPVEVTIAGKEVKISSSSNGTTMYEPYITYSYKVSGKTFYGDNLFTTRQIRSSRQWALGWLKGYTPGKSYRGYFRTGDPSTSFLVKQHSFLSYVFILFPLLFLEIAVAIVFQPDKRDLSSHRPGMPGWFPLSADLPLATKVRWLGMVTGVWVLVTVATLGHYAVVAERPYSVWFYVVSPVYGIIGVALALKWLKMQGGLSQFQDPILFTNEKMPAFGQTFSVNVTLRSRRSTIIDKVAVGLKCTRTNNDINGTTNIVAFENHQDIPEGANLAMKSAQSFSAEKSIVVPTSVKDTGRFSIELWTIVLKVKCSDGTELNQEYPIVIADTVDPELQSHTKHEGQKLDIIDKVKLNHHINEQP